MSDRGDPQWHGYSPSRQAVVSQRAVAEQRSQRRFAVPRAAVRVELLVATTVTGRATSSHTGGSARTFEACSRRVSWCVEVESIQAVTFPPLVEVNNVRFLNPAHEKALIVYALDAVPGNGSVMTVSVHFLNCTQQRIVLAARTFFLDSDRFLLGATSASQHVHLDPSTTGPSAVNERAWMRALRST